jgi:NMD protein affecting ribosome stability and mRNA decay
MTANVIKKTLLCKDCSTMTVGLWYTKRGREQRMCMKCGKYLDIKGEKIDGRATDSYYS